MVKPIDNEQITRLLDKIKLGLLGKGIAKEIVENTTMVAVHPEYWEVSLRIPYNIKPITTKDIRAKAEKVLFDECGVKEEFCDYMGRQTMFKAYDWFFRHPETPEEICNLIEMEMEESEGEEIGLGLPVPSGVKSKSEEVFLTVRYDVFDALSRGEKLIEYRNLNQYYCDKFFSPGVKKRYVRFNKGYEKGEENQIVFEIDEIMIGCESGDYLISAQTLDGKLIKSYSQIPKGFAPCVYAIKLGKRIG